MPPDELREGVAQFVSADVQPENFKILPGLLVGDVIVYVEDEKANRGPVRAWPSGCSMRLDPRSR